MDVGRDVNPIGRPDERTCVLAVDVDFGSVEDVAEVEHHLGGTLQILLVDVEVQGVGGFTSFVLQLIIVAPIANGMVGKMKGIDGDVGCAEGEGTEGAGGV